MFTEKKRNFIKAMQEIQFAGINMDNYVLQTRHV